MAKKAHHRVALEAARFLADGTESEYLHAKHRALTSLGLSDQTRLPSNKTIRSLITGLVKSELGEDEVRRRLRDMREIALEVMTLIDDFDPFLIGSTLSGEIREGSDIDLQAYCDDYREIQDLLTQCGYEDVEEERVQNLKGEFLHLKWHEREYPVEITIYPWDWREIVPISSITGKAMKRADTKTVRKLTRTMR